VSKWNVGMREKCIKDEKLGSHHIPPIEGVSCPCENVMINMNQYLQQMNEYCSNYKRDSQVHLSYSSHAFSQWVATTNFHPIFPICNGIYTPVKDTRSGDTETNPHPFFTAFHHAFIYLYTQPISSRKLG